MNRFRRQFIISRIDRFPDGYSKHFFDNGYILAWDSELAVRISNDGSVVLIGDAWQSDPHRDAPDLEVINLKADELPDFEIFEMEKSWVGEYVLLVGKKVYTDASALRCVYYTDKIVAGDIHLIDYNLNRSEQIIKTVLLTGIPFVPAPIIDMKRNIRMLLPSQVLNYEYMTVSKRPLMIDDYRNESVVDLRDLFVERFCFSLQEMRKKLTGTIWLSLTGGRDSRATLALLKKSGIDFNSFTIERFGFLNGGLEDMFYPPVLASRLGVPHYYFKLKYAQYNNEMFCEYLQNSYGLIQGISINDYAYGIHDDLRRISKDNKLVWIRSSMWETYCNYLVNNYLPSDDHGWEDFLSYNNHRLKNCEESIESFREYYDWVSRYPEQSINIANRFYWEEGGAAWMAPTERVTEMSEGITAAQPLNSRVFLSVLLSLPAEYRNGRLFQRKMTEYLFPETNGFGYSVDKKYYDMPYYFPYHLFSINSVILLYGAGKAGQVSLKRVKRDDFITVAAILDERADELVEIDGVPVVLPEKYKDYSFDYIFIAIRDATIAWQVKRNLINIGIEEDKIKYTQPLLFCTEEG